MNRRPDPIRMRLRHLPALLLSLPLLALANISRGELEKRRRRWRILYKDHDFAINYDINATYHELAFPIPNLWNDQPNYLHKIEVIRKLAPA